jgi:hypothetical protein
LLLRRQRVAAAKKEGIDVILRAYNAGVARRNLAEQRLSGRHAPARRPTEEQMAWPLHAPRVPTLDVDAVVRMARNKDTLAGLARYLHDPTVFSDIAKARPIVIESSVSDAHLSALLDAGIVEPSPDDDIGRCGIVFCVAEEAKKRLRPIFWPRQLNDELERAGRVPVPVLDDTVAHAAKVRAGTWAVTADLKASFFQLALAPDVRRFFCFVVGGRVFRMARLPMGASHAPAVMHAVLGALSNFTAHCRFDRYIDNIRFHGARDDVAAALKIFRHRCEEAGATIKDEPLCHTPHEVGEFLGLRYSYRLGWTQLPPAFVLRLRAKADAVLAEHPQPPSTVADVLSLFGLLVFASRAQRLPLGEHFWAIAFARRLCSNVANGKADFDSTANFWPSARSRWLSWVAQVATNSPTRHVADDEKPPAFALATDASLLGWGAVLVDLARGVVQQAAGRWSASHSSGDINELEMRALELGLQAFAHTLTEHPNAPLRVHLDNDAAAAILRKGIAREPVLNATAMRVLRSLAGQRPVSAVRVDTAVNPADPLSRGAEPFGREATLGALGTVDAGVAVAAPSASVER